MPWDAGAMNCKAMLGEFGTFDVENYGDLLYPVLLEKMFRKRGHTMDIRKFSLMGGGSVRDSGYPTWPVRQLFSSEPKQPYRLIVGGGDLLRTDWDVVASHYSSIYRRERQRSLPSRLRRLIRKCLGVPVDAISQFRDEHMNYPAVGPFIIDPVRCPGVTSVAYCSCGVPFPFAEAVQSRVAGAFSRASFVYVRDRQSRDALVNAGVEREIHVGPDFIVVLSDFLDPATERNKGRSLLEQRGIDGRRRILCVQTHPLPDEQTVELVKQLRVYQNRTGAETILLPVGWCHGDSEYLSRVAQLAEGAFKYLEIASVFEIISVLAASSTVIATSLHCNVTAFSFGIPHLFAPTTVAKAAGFLDVANLSKDLKLNSWTEVNQKLDLAAGLNSDYFISRASAAKGRVNEVFDLLIQSLAAP